MATGKKRVLDESAGNPKSKKTKLDGQEKQTKTRTEKQAQSTSTLVPEDVDFPRGGGTSFTPLEVKTIRAEAVKEANDELFEEAQVKTAKHSRRKSDVKGKGKNAANGEKSESVRVEHLNYKRVTVGMKILGQIVSIQPLALIVSLPNQLHAHVPITHISTQFTSLLEAMDEDEDSASSHGEDEDVPSKSRVPDLFEIFHPGQYVRAVVSAVHAPGSTDAAGLGRARDEVQKASRRLELSLIPEKVNAGVSKADLRSGFTMPAAVKSVEDHGYILDLGLSDVSGFLSFKEAKKALSQEDSKFRVGQILDVHVSKLSANGRTCTVTVDSAVLRSACVSEVTTVTSILPGALVQSLVTAILPSGLNLQVLGYFGGTIDLFHLPPGDLEERYKIGQKLKARILYDVSPSTPPRFALSLAEHVIKLVPKSAGSGEDTSLPAAYPIGTVLDTVKVTQVETERGLIVQVASGVEGFVHISQTSDDHVPSLSSSTGPWKVGTTHRARVTGYFMFDGLLQLSLRPSVLEQKFLQVGEVEVGELVKGTVKKLTDSAMFVSISGSVDGVVWPNHYADIPLKHPQKRFKPGASIKCRVLVVDSERKRIALTAKRTLIDSTLPIISKFEDAQVGMITHAVVFRASEKGLQVEFYNNLKAYIPVREASETAVGALSTAFPVGKPVQVRIIGVDLDSLRITASIRQSAPNFKTAIVDISGVEVGNKVEGVVSEIHKEKAIVILHPTQIRALLSLNNLANRRKVTVAQLRASLKVGEKVEDLVVTTRSPEKGSVLVAMRPKEKEMILQKGALSIDTIQIGQLVGGRVLSHGHRGTMVKLTTSIAGFLQPTDTSDDYDSGKTFPAVDTLLKAAVVAVDKEKKQVMLSTRPSRMYPDQNKPVVDREITSLLDLKVGDTIRGFIKSVAEHGLFVTLGRNIDARVQIRELFDEFVKDWKSRFTANQLVKGRITSINYDKKQVELTLRSGEIKQDGSSLSLAELSPGQKIEGKIKKVEDYGLFISIEGSKLSGLCHKSELSDSKDGNVTLALRSFKEGDRVKAVVLSVDLETRRLSLGLKPSYFVDEDFQSDEEGEGEGDDAEPETFGIVEDDVAAPESMEVPDAETDGSDNSDEEDEMEIDAGTTEIDMTIRASFDEGTYNRNNSAKNILPAPSLKLNGGFQWSAETQQGDDDVVMESSSDEDEARDGDQGGKKKKRRRKEIEHDFTADMHTKVPESNADFERVLLGSPNSSYLWIQYMSLQLQLSEIEKAREIAKRAFNTISFREEQEKLNVWIALLNLENVYGTDETLEATFKDAARHNDSKTVHLRLATILEQSDKFDKAEEQYQKTCKKFGQSSKVWTLSAEYHLKRGELEKARKLLPRSLQSLEKRKHLKTISKFAQLEYKLGDPERGKTIFEGIVDSHPKRWDLWSIYLDMEAGQGDIQSLRNVFDRIFTLKMTSHKAKSFFKKWLELERRLGDDDGAAAVKAKAVEWTQRAAGSS